MVLGSPPDAPIVIRMTNMNFIRFPLPRIEIGYDLIPDPCLNRESLDLRGVGNHTYREDYTKKDFDHILSDQKDWKFSAISSLNSIFLR